MTQRHHDIALVDAEGTLLAKRYLHHFNTGRPHRRLAQFTPAQAGIQPPPVINLADHQVRRRPILGGLTSEYQIAA
jgi:putative transposase